MTETVLGNANQIISPGELRLMVGLEATITDAEEMALTVLHPMCEQAVTNFLGYDPVQRQRTEFYPRGDATSNIPALREDRWEPNRSHTVAQIRRNRGNGQRTLQMKHLPIREIITIHQDLDGRFGQGLNTPFDTDTLLITGDEYWVEFEEANLGESGLIINHGIWAGVPGSVRVIYIAGYSQEEFAGRAFNATTSAPYTNVGVNASGIRRAVILTFAQAFATYFATQKSQRLGKMLPGILSSEKIGDYSYNLNTSQMIASMTVAIPTAAEDALEEFRHWGLSRL